MPEWKEGRGWSFIAREVGGGRPFWKSLLKDFQTDLLLHLTFLEMAPHKSYLFVKVNLLPPAPPPPTQLIGVEQRMF